MKLHYDGYTDEQVAEACRNIQSSLNYWVYENVGKEWYTDDYVEKMKFLEMRIDESVYDRCSDTDDNFEDGFLKVELIEPEQALSAEDFKTYMEWKPVGFMK